MLAILVIISLFTNYGTSVAAQKGKVLQVTDVRNGKFVLYEQNLKEILAKIPESTEVGVLSIAGEYRKGKSFLLNFFLQYLEYRKSCDVTSPIMGEQELKTTLRKGTFQHPWLRNMDTKGGFQFRSGNERETTGINMWSEPFIIQSKDNGKRIAILVMDSQGLYDAHTKRDDNVRLFNMVSMLSSTLIMNTPQNMNYNQLKELKYFLKYASASTTITQGTKLFQTISFLFRDFTLEEQKGYEAGTTTINRFLIPNANQSNDVITTANALKKGFTKITGFALPRPGNKVTKSDFDGSLKVIDFEFLEYLQRYVVSIVDDMEPKHPMVYNLTAIDFIKHVKNMAESFNQNLSPGELLRLQETQLANRVTDTLESLVQKHIDSLRSFVEEKNITFYSNLTNTHISSIIEDRHFRMKNQVLSSHVKNETMKFILRLDGDNQPMTALKILDINMEAGYTKIKNTLMRIAANKKSEAELREQERQAIESGNKRELDRVQRELKKLLEERKRGNIIWKIGSKILELAVPAIIGGLFG